MQLLVYEHVSGGGFANEKLSPSILSEGYGMLRSLVSDFKAAGHNVTTSLDSRLKAFNPPIEADNIVSISFSNELNKNLKKFSKAVDAVYVIAPESGQTLQKLVELVETSGGLSLNSQIDAIKNASNKMTTYEVLKERRLMVPETVMISIHEDVKHVKHVIKELGFPLVFKPVDGVGCCGLSVVKDESHVVAAVKKIAKESLSEHFVAQKLIEGISVSASLISTGEKALPITLNKQMVTLASPYEKSSYNGGIVPFGHVLEKEALKAAQTAVESISGLRGYVGVDMALTRNGPVVIEVNPRLTTSYIGLRKAVNFNPAQAIIDAVLRRRLPENIQRVGYAFFSKVKVPPVCQVLSETYGLKEMVSPPFPTVIDEPASALLAVHSNRLENAKMAFYRARKSLLKLFDRGDYEW
ncbi:MAG: ATP-grasp domain-containing protein [Candidatus Bathyarchaeia archaeon]